MGIGNTTPPDAFTPELEAMIAVMSGDETSARQWIARISDPGAFRRQLARLDGLMEAGAQRHDGLPDSGGTS